MICYQNWHKEEDRSNYNELIILNVYPKVRIFISLLLPTEDTSFNFRVIELNACLENCFQKLQLVNVEVFVKRVIQETLICQHSAQRKLETPKFKHSALGLKFHFFS